MSYQFEDDEPVGDAVPRVMIELIDTSMALLEGLDRQSVASAVHETRKNCKKGRALARLVRPALGDEYRVANCKLRDAARALAPIRDPQALLETLDDLVASEGLDPSHDVPEVRHLLAMESERAADGIIHGLRLERTHGLLAETREHVAHWEVVDSYEPVGRGLKKTYRRGRQGLARSQVDAEAATFHEWRKRVKYLWYQIRLVREAAPSLLRPFAESLHDLSDALGDAHDLAILTDHLDDWERDVDDGELETVRKLAGEKRHELEQRAVSLGRCLYVEKPGSFVDRIGGYWRIWR